MTVIADKDRDTVRELLARDLVRDVKLLFFTRSPSHVSVPGRQECETCDETRELLDDLASLSDRLHLTTCDIAADPVAATRYNVTAVPTVLLQPMTSAHGSQVSEKPGPAEEPPASLPNVRFVGLPGGYEFTTLLADIVDVSKGATELAPETLDVVLAVDRPVQIQVFVTPTCPYCPRAARLAHMLAMENPLIVADVIEANEFPDLRRRYRVRSVPKTVINDRVEFVGSLSEPKLLEALDQALAHA